MSNQAIHFRQQKCMKIFPSILCRFFQWALCYKWCIILIAVKISKKTSLLVLIFYFPKDKKIQRIGEITICTTNLSLRDTYLVMYKSSSPMCSMFAERKMVQKMCIFSFINTIFKKINMLPWQLWCKATNMEARSDASCIIPNVKLPHYALGTISKVLYLCVLLHNLSLWFCTGYPHLLIIW